MIKSIIFLSELKNFYHKNVLSDIVSPLFTEYILRISLFIEIYQLVQGYQLVQTQYTSNTKCTQFLVHDKICQFRVLVIMEKLNCRLITTKSTVTLRSMYIIL